MFNKTVMATALAAVLCAQPALAADSRELAQLRAQINAMKNDYEQRLQAMEKRLQASEARQAANPVAAAAAPAAAPATAASTAAAASAPTAPPAPAAASAIAATSSASNPSGATATTAAAPAASDAYVAAAPAAGPAGVGTGTGFNPAVSLILGGGYANLSQDPGRYRIQGFMPGGEIGPGKRGFNLGESELTLAANIDPRFAGQLTFSLAPDDTVSVEEAFFQTLGLANGVNLKAGRFLSSVGYLNSQHAHTWDFVDAPLAYQAFFGGQFKPEGVQARWLAPTERFTEIGLELGRGSTFPGNDRNRNGIGSAAVFAHVGDDIGESASYRAGLSYLHTSADRRGFDDTDAAGNAVVNGFTGRSGTLIADAVYKWSPNGNPVQTNLKLQGEYFRRTDRGSLVNDLYGMADGGSYRNAQSGWYLQSVYQFTAGWRAGLRYDRLDAGTPVFGSGLATADFTQLATYHPHRTTAMIDWSPSEFSRFRLQYAQDRARPDATDNQIFLQYIMSLGAHGAHTF